MITRRLLLTTIGLAACARSDRTTQVAPGLARPRDSIAAPAFRSDCSGDTNAIHRNPRALLEEALARNARGEQARGEIVGWWQGASECPEHAPGWDTAVIVTGWHVDSIEGSQDSVRFAVRFDAVGSAAGAKFQFAPRGVVDTVTLIRVATGWRLAEYGIDLFLYPATVRAMFDFDDTSRTARLLDSISAASRTRSGGR